MLESGTESTALTELCSLAMGVAVTTVRGREAVLGLSFAHREKGRLMKLNDRKFDGEESSGVGVLRKVPELQGAVVMLLFGLKLQLPVLSNASDLDFGFH